VAAGSASVVTVNDKEVQMDIRDRVMGDMPNSFLHKIAGIVPGFNGYMDRERRRDADKLLRTYLARQYSTQRDHLTRVQQGLLRAHQFDSIAEVERLSGILQRFIDRLSTATYGYTGLFDPVKVEAQDLDQLYAFDMALTSGVDEVSSAIGNIESAVTGNDAESGQQVPAALSQLGTILDDLNNRLNQRSDLLTTGRGVPSEEYNRLVDQLNQATAGAPPPTGVGAAPYTAPPPPEVPRGGAPTMPMGSGPGMSQSTSMGTSGGGEMARYPGGSASTAGVGQGTPTTDIGVGGVGQPTPGVSSMSEGNQGFGEMPSNEVMDLGNRETTGGFSGAMPTGGTAGSGIETASSPSTAPGAPGGDLVDGVRLENSMGAPGTGETAGGAGDPLNDRQS
jgi:hypothetical protein